MALNSEKLIIKPILDSKCPKLIGEINSVWTGISLSHWIAALESIFTEEDITDNVSRISKARDSIDYNQGSARTVVESCTFTNWEHLIGTLDKCMGSRNKGPHDMFAEIINLKKK